jgi:hypothetical protein
MPGQIRQIKDQSVPWILYACLPGSALLFAIFVRQLIFCACTGLAWPGLFLGTRPRVLILESKSSVMRRVVLCKPTSRRAHICVSYEYENCVLRPSVQVRAAQNSNLTITHIVACVRAAQCFMRTVRATIYNNIIRELWVARLRHVVRLKLRLRLRVDCATEIWISCSGLEKMRTVRVVASCIAIFAW